MATNDLTASLVDVAAEAIHGADCGCAEWSVTEPGEDHTYLSQAVASALAVLEKLSEQTHEFAYLNGGDLQDLADAIREGR